MNDKKICSYALIVLILAGIIVVLLKGFNVSIDLRQHESIRYSTGKDINVFEIRKIAKDVFGKKPFTINLVEIFNDSVSINAIEITEEEKDSIITKIREKYEITDDETEVSINSKPGARLREIANIYIVPTLISFVLIYISYLIRFYKNINIAWKEIGKSILYLLEINLGILSLIAITRIPFSEIIIPVLLVISLGFLIIYFNRVSKKINNV